MLGFRDVAGLEDALFFKAARVSHCPNTCSSPTAMKEGRLKMLLLHPACGCAEIMGILERFGNRATCVQRCQRVVLDQ